MTPHQRRVQTATETLAILQEKRYCYDGTEYELGKEIDACLAGTVTHEVAPPFPENPGKTGSLNVTTESTTAAIQRCLALGGHVAALNFASAINPGGGFETGAQAQEECLARASALYPSQLTQKGAFYDSNKAENKPFYAHRMIWSPQVPFFRDENDYLTEPFLAGVITAAAPNQARIPDEMKAQTPAIFKQRIRTMLAIAAHHQMDHLILGAWGCGVFGNNPKDVAAWFHVELEPMKAHFESVTFAIFCPQGPDANLLAFQTEFPTQA